ncbi:hypothetical protein CYMTET_24782 [Cymbomonas tetramitiformis]|uniref:N-acetyltransferase domain-containing protein n=1 Tax=Cymbomonas tetramitiformis TaxID=36881 RepID=A0AAE0FVL1_9CHLO|nr:hypothetical protein CYMTET_24782 [Cymbomonas tetramitiformis]
MCFGCRPSGLANAHPPVLDDGTTDDTDTRGRCWPYMANLAVQSDMRRQGLGRLLIDAAEQVATSWGYSELVLKVEDDNAAALELYESMGYEEVGRDEHAMTLHGDAIFGSTVQVTIRILRKTLVELEKNHYIEE